MLFLNISYPYLSMEYNSSRCQNYSDNCLVTDDRNARLLINWMDIFMLMSLVWVAIYRCKAECGYETRLV